MVLSVAWWLQLRSYRILSAAKWDVIVQLEKALPARPFTDEWTSLKKDPVERAISRYVVLGRLRNAFGRYAELGVVEQVVPVIFLVLFTVTLIHALK